MVVVWLIFSNVTHTQAHHTRKIITHPIRVLHDRWHCESSIISDSSCENKSFPTCDKTWSCMCWQINSKHKHKYIKCCENLKETRDSIWFYVIFSSVCSTHLSKHVEKLYSMPNTRISSIWTVNIIWRLDWNRVRERLTSRYDKIPTKVNAAMVRFVLRIGHYYSELRPILVISCYGIDEYFPTPILVSQSSWYSSLAVIDARILTIMVWLQMRCNTRVSERFVFGVLLRKRKPRHKKQETQTLLHAVANVGEIQQLNTVVFDREVLLYAYCADNDDGQTTITEKNKTKY